MEYKRCSLSKKDLKTLSSYSDMKKVIKNLKLEGLGLHEICFKNGLKYYRFICIGDNNFHKLTIVTDLQGNILRGYKVLKEV